MFMKRAWILPTLLALSGSVLAAGLLSSGTPGAAAALLLFFVLLAGVNSPLIFPRSISVLEARRRSAVDGRPIVFWRRAAHTACDCASDWAAAPAGRTGSTSGMTRLEPQR